MFNVIDLGTAFMAGVLFTLVVITVIYGRGDPPHPRG